MEKARIQLRSFLVNKGILINDSRLPRQESTLIQIHKFITEYFDERDEFEKDIWDFRKIPGARFPEHESHFILNFNDIPIQFRAIVKRFMKIRITTCSHENMLERNAAMTSKHPRNTDGVKQYALKKSEATERKVNEAIQRLIKANSNINFNSISMESGVSKSYLYNNKEIRNRIETLREQQDGLPSEKHVKQKMTDNSKDVLIAAKNKRIKALEAENKQLKDELVKLRGMVYDKF